MTLESYRLEDVIELYLMRCEAEGKSQDTVITCQEILNQFLEAVRDLGLPDDVGR